MANAVQAADEHRWVPGGLDDLEWLGCVFPDGVTVEAEARPDLPWRFMFQGWHPVHGERYFRARRRGSSDDGPTEIELWDVTEAYARLAGRRLKGSHEKANVSVKVQRARIKASAYSPKPGSPTPERRRHGAVAGEPLARAAIADPYDGDARLVHRAPDRLVAMQRRGTLTAAQLHEAARFHTTYLKAGLDPARAANMMRARGGAGTRLPDPMLDAQATVFGIYDHLGGRTTLAARVLVRIVGEGHTIQECVGRELRGPLNGHKRDLLVGVLTAALDAVAGYHGTRSKLAAMRARALEGTVTGLLSQGT